MRRLLLCILSVGLACMTGCAVAVTANVDMPDALVTPAPVQALSIEAADMPAYEILPESTPAAAPLSAVPSEGRMAQGTAASDALVAAFAPSQSDATLATPVPDVSASPAPTPEQTPESTPEPTPEPAPEPTPAFTVKAISETAGYVYAKTVNLRSGPDTDYDVLGEYERNDTLAITGKSGDWYQVEVGGKTGFMLMEYVKEGPVPTEAPEPTPKPVKTAKPTAEPTAKPEPTPEPTPAVFADPAPAANTSALADDLYLVAQLVDEESGADGYLAVANVIYNRVRSSKFPNTIQGVVFQSNQFTPADNEAELRAVVPAAGAIDAVAQIFVNGNTILPDNVLYFRAARSGTNWGSRVYFGSFGGNAFFS